MKKALSLILAIVLCLGLCACGVGTETPTEPAVTKATIVTNEGNTVEMSAEDLFKEFDGNEARFNKLYRGATITFTGTVKYIKADTAVYSGNSVRPDQNKIVFEDGWCLIIGYKNDTYDLADYYPGQKLEVTTGIISPAFDTEFLQEVADNSRVVWLVGNDWLYTEQYNTQTTKITPVA